jgi:hypothetical protein
MDMAEVFVKAFKVVDEAGVIYEAHEYQNMIDTSDLDGPSSIGGMKSYRLANGTHLNSDGDGFTNYRTGAKLTRK